MFLFGFNLQQKHAMCCVCSLVILLFYTSFGITTLRTQNKIYILKNFNIWHIFTKLLQKNKGLFKHINVVLFCGVLKKMRFVIYLQSVMQIEIEQKNSFSSLNKQLPRVIVH